MRHGQDSELLVLNVVTVVVVVVTVVERKQTPFPFMQGRDQSRLECRPACRLPGVQAKEHTQPLRLQWPGQPPLPLSAAAMPGSLPTSPWLHFIVTN